MKKENSLKKMILFIVVLVGFSVSAQNNYKAEDLSIDFLKQTYESALMNITKVEDNYIVVKDVFDIYVEIDANKRYVALSAAYTLREDATDAEIL